MAISGMSQYGFFLDGKIPKMDRLPGNVAVLEKDFRFLGRDGYLHVAKEGLIYDGASIPRLLWGLSTNPWADDVIGPATIHDWYCKLGRECRSPFDSQTVHYNFYLGLKAIRVPEWRARVRWLAVHHWGPKFTALTSSSTKEAA
jgi:hypothetical protein